MTVAEAIDSFLFHCRYEKNLSPKTLKAYGTDLRQFGAFLGERCAEPVGGVDRTVLRAYIQGLYAKLAEKSIKRKVATLKALFRYLEREDTIAASPFRKMDVRIREPRRLPRTLALSQMEAILGALYRERDQQAAQHGAAYATSVRDVALVEMLFATGARVSEVCGLRLGAVDLDEGTVRILGKGRRERILHLTDEEVLDALQRYLQIAPGAREPDAFFFQNRFGRRLSEQAVRAILRRHAAKAGGEVRLTPHVIRHSVATLLLEEGVDIRYIQTLLGHSSITTTQIYTQVQDAAQRRVIAGRHPRRRFRSAAS